MTQDECAGGGLAPAEDKTAGWYAGSSEERLECGPCNTRDEAIAEALIRETYSGFEERGKWKAWIFYMEGGELHFECGSCGNVPEPCDWCFDHLDPEDCGLIRY